MSDPLDKLFRDRQSNVPSATPPPGQWERIRNREMVLEPGQKRLVPFWGLALALCFGLGVGIPGGAYFFGGQCPATSVVGGADAVASVDEASGGPMVEATEAISPTSPAPALLRPNTLSGSVSERTVASVSAETARRPVVNTTVKESVPVFDQRPVASKEAIGLVTAQENLNEAARPPLVQENKVDLSTPDYPQKEVQTAIYALLPLEQDQVTSTRFSSLQSTLVSTATSAPMNPVKITNRKPSPLARWETGLHVSPWLSNANTSVQKYTETDNGRSPQEFEFEGQDISLYSTDRYNPNLKRRLQIEFVSFDVARQFGNGLRMGLGMTWSPRQREGLIDQKEYLNDQLSAGEWATSFSSERQDIYLTAQVDYTFMRRRRFRPYLGVTLRYHLYGDFNYQQVLFERNSGRSDIIISLSAINRFGFQGRSLFPRTGFQYDLTNRISVGLEVFPGVGIGGRWKL